MKIAFMLVLSIICSVAQAKPGKMDGVNVILERRTMKAAPEKPVRQIMQGGSMLSLYGDGSIKTQAVRCVKMSKKTKEAVASKLSDEELLASAKSLAKQIKATHSSKVKGLSDAEVVSSAEAVFDTTTSSTTKAIVSALLAAGAVAATKKGKKS